MCLVHVTLSEISPPPPPGHRKKKSLAEIGLKITIVHLSFNTIRDQIRDQINECFESFRCNSVGVSN